MCACFFARLFVLVFVFVCLFVSESERASERKRETERVCVYVCLHQETLVSEQCINRTSTVSGAARMWKLLKQQSDRS